MPYRYQSNSEVLRLAQAELDDEISSQVKDETLLGNRYVRWELEKTLQTQMSRRFPLELLQNSNDAQKESSSVAEVIFHLTSHSLIVADSGVGFSDESIRAISRSGQSTKSPDKSVGHKGVGFKSVLTVTKNPQIITPNISFEFSEERLREHLLAVRPSLILEAAEIPILEYPFPLESVIPDEDQVTIDELLGAGFKTFVRLPLTETSRSFVSECLNEFLIPQVMLFLENVSLLRVVDDDRDLRIKVTRPVSATKGFRTEVVTIETNDDSDDTQWRIFHCERDVPEETIGPLLSLGKSWADLKTVPLSIAFPIDKGEVLCKSQQPFYTFFPTEMGTQLPFIINSKFFLTIDRKEFPDDAITRPFNESLLSLAADFITETVAVELARSYPASGSVLEAFIPSGNSWGTPALVREFLTHLSTDLRRVKFVRMLDKSLGAPCDSLVLPAEIIGDFKLEYFNSTSLHASRIIDLALIAKDSHRNAAISLDATEIELIDLLGDIALPVAGREVDFYKRLVSWTENTSSDDLKVLFGECSVVRSSDGSWLKPSEDIFLPSLRPNPKVSMKQHVVSVPGDDLGSGSEIRDFLARIGVDDWSWRPILRKYCFPILNNRSISGGARRTDALNLLYTYLTEEGGDQDLIRAASQLLFKSRDSVGSVALEAQPRLLYFGKDWNVGIDLENVLGVVGRKEFIVDEFAQFDNDIELHEKLYRLLGVNARLRLVEVHDPSPHPLVHFLESNEVHRCERGNGSYQVKRDFYIDRFAEAIAQAERFAEMGDLVEFMKRLKSLTSLITDSEFLTLLDKSQSLHQCYRHQACATRVGHCTGWYQVRFSDWLAVLIMGEVRFRSPHEVYVTDNTTPSLIQEMLGTLHPDIEASHQVLKSLGVRGISQASLDSLMDLMDQFAENIEVPSEVVESSVWAMSRIDELVRKGGNIPRRFNLLSRRNGDYCFAKRPVVIRNQVLASIWEGKDAVFANPEFINLIEGCNLQVVSESPMISGVTLLETESFVQVRQDILELLEAAIPPVLCVIDRTETQHLASYRQLLSNLIVCPVGTLRTAYKIGDSLSAETPVASVPLEIHGHWVLVVSTDLNLDYSVPDIFRFVSTASGINNHSATKIAPFFDATESEIEQRLTWFRLSIADLSETATQSEEVINSLWALNTDTDQATPPSSDDTNLAEYLRRFDKVEPDNRRDPPSDVVVINDSGKDEAGTQAKQKLKRGSSAEPRPKPIRSSREPDLERARRRRSAKARDEAKAHQKSQDHGKDAEKLVNDLLEEAKADGKLLDFKWISADESDSAGFDFWYEVSSGHRVFMDVKSIASDRAHDDVFITANEWSEATEKYQNFEIWRVYDGGIRRIVNPAKQVDDGESQLFPSQYVLHDFNLEVIDFLED